jgi:DegV family protein with EDD domain
MKLAIITDSTCDLTAERLNDLGVARVPLYVHFQGKTYKDWIEITPKELVEGIKAGAATPSTSQPSPQDFTNAYDQASGEGASDILCITISSTLSGTYQSAVAAAKEASVPVTVFDSMAASIGLGMMVERAVEMRDEGKSLEEIVRELERIRDTALLRFTVATLEFLQKGGRIGRAQALVGGLLNIKPILGLRDGKVEPAGRARGAKKALKEIVDAVKDYAAKHPGKPVVHFVHVQDLAAAENMRQELEKAGVDFVNAGTYEMGAVIATHVGPGTYGVYLYPRASA